METNYGKLKKINRWCVVNCLLGEGEAADGGSCSTVEMLTARGGGGNRAEQPLATGSSGPHFPREDTRAGAGRVRPRIGQRAGDPRASDGNSQPSKSGVTRGPETAGTPAHPVVTADAWEASSDI